MKATPLLEIENVSFVEHCNCKENLSENYCTLKEEMALKQEERYFLCFLQIL